ncbi:MAG: C-GCAxxG-C-C family protein [Anaerovoracaceae bacterium]
MNNVKRALALHSRGFNCAQSVACPFCDTFDVDKETVFRLAEGFGFGMGTAGTCGAVTAMSMVIGMNLSDGNLDNPKSKAKCYAMMKKLTNEFQEKNGSILCCELKGLTGGPVLRSCNGCIEDAVKLLEKNLEK